MHESQQDQKPPADAARVMRDLKTLKQESVNVVDRVTDEMDHSTENLATLVNTGVATLGNEILKVKDDATQSVAHAATTVKKNVGEGLSQYNAKADEVARKLPGGIGDLAGRYPWVAFSLALFAGFLVRGFLMPRR